MLDMRAPKYLSVLLVLAIANSDFSVLLVLTQQIRRSSAV